jgi:hypothetical protein
VVNFFQIVKEQTAPGFKKTRTKQMPIRLVLASFEISPAPDTG